MKVFAGKRVQPWRFLAVGLVLAGLGYLLPGPGGSGTGLFWRMARESTWDIPVQWPAVVCALRMIALGLGGCLITMALAEIFVILRILAAAAFCFFLTVFPLLIFSLGMFYVIKGLF